MTQKPSSIPVAVWAREYETHRVISGATITDVVTRQTWTTGEDGYARISLPYPRRLTLAFSKAGFPAMQTATVTVPESGLTTRDEEITFQVPGMPLYKVLQYAMGRQEPGKHHLVCTVSAAGHNLHDDIGEGGVAVSLLRADDGKLVRDDGIYLGNILGKTEWLRPVLAERVSLLRAWKHKVTSHDGGVLFKNVEPGDYILQASKKDGNGGEMRFESARATIYPHSPETINLSPPHGPRVMG